MIAKEDVSVSLLDESLCYHIRKDLCTNNNDIETLPKEIENKRSKKIILNIIYRQPNRDLKVSEYHFNDFFFKNKKNYKKITLVGNFNITVLDFETNEKVEKLLNQMFSHNMIPTINRPTRVTRNTATAIDHFITNTAVDTEFKSEIIQTDLSDHFLIMFGLKADENMVEKHREHFFIRNIMMKNQQTYLSKNCTTLNMTLRIQKSPMTYTENFSKLSVEYT